MTISDIKIVLKETTSALELIERNQKLNELNLLERQALNLVSRRELLSQQSGKDIDYALQYYQDWIDFFFNYSYIDEKGNRRPLFNIGPSNVRKD